MCKECLLTQTIEHQESTAACNEEQINISIARSRGKRLVRLFQFMRFCLVGGANTLLDLCIFNILLWIFPTQSTVNLLVYNSIAYAIGSINSFVLNKYWTFQSKRSVRHGEFVRFILTTVAGIGCNNLIIWFLSSLFHPFMTHPLVWANASKILAIFGTTLISYFGMRLWVFVK